MTRKRLFIIAFFVFIAVMIAVLADMARRTTAPWNRTKSTQQVQP